MYWFWPWLWKVSFLEELWGGTSVVATELTPDDLDGAAALHQEAFDQPWSGDELASLLSQKGSFGIVARRVGRSDEPPLGFVLARNTEGEAEILTIAVDRRARGHGVGRMLMDQLLQRLYAEGAEALFLEVDEENPAALALYRRLRFEEVGRRPAYYAQKDGRRTSALTLKRTLR